MLDTVTWDLGDAGPWQNLIGDLSHHFGLCSGHVEGVNSCATWLVGRRCFPVCPPSRFKRNRPWRFSSLWIPHKDDQKWLIHAKPSCSVLQWFTHTHYISLYSLSLSLLHQRCFILLTPTFTSQQSNRFLPDLCCEVKLLSELILRREGWRLAGGI